MWPRPRIITPSRTACPPYPIFGVAPMIPQTTQGRAVLAPADAAQPARAGGLPSAGGLTPPETLHLPARIQQTLFAGEERVAAGADVDSQRRLGGASDERIPAGTMDLGGPVLRVDACLHERNDLPSSRLRLGEDAHLFAVPGRVRIANLA